MFGAFDCKSYYLKSIDVKYGDRPCIISWVNQLVNTVCQPVEQKGVQDLGNGISGVFKVENVSVVGRNFCIKTFSQTHRKIWIYCTRLPGINCTFNRYRGIDFLPHCFLWRKKIRSLQRYRYIVTEKRLLMSSIFRLNIMWRMCPNEYLWCYPEYVKSISKKTLVFYVWTQSWASTRTEQLYLGHLPNTARKRYLFDTWARIGIFDTRYFGYLSSVYYAPETLLCLRHKHSNRDYECIFHRRIWCI